MAARALPVAQLRRYVGILIGGVVLGMYGVILMRAKFGRDNIFGLANKFDPRWEASFHSWLGSALLMGCAAILACIATCPRKATSRFNLQWGILAAGFAFLSADESAELHEMLIGLSKAAFGQSSIPHLWTVFGIIGIAVLGYAYIPFLRHLSPWMRHRTILSAAIYLGGAIGMELLGGWYGAVNGMRGPVYLALAATEETMELIGAGLFLLSLYQFALESGPEVASEAHG